MTRKLACEYPLKYGSIPINEDDSDLLLFWKDGDGVNPTVGPELTSNGSPTAGEGTPWVDSAVSGITSTSFDGSNDYLADSDALDPGLTEDFRATVVGRVELGAGNVKLFGTYQATKGFSVYYNSGALYFDVVGDSTVSVNVAYTAGTWFILDCFCDRDGNQSVFLNGVTTDSDTSPAGTVAGTGVGIAALPDGSNKLSGQVVWVSYRAGGGYTPSVDALETAHLAMGVAPTTGIGTQTFTRASLATAHCPDRVQLLTDGDMEAAGVGDWTIYNNAVATKETGSPHGGSQVLRVAYNGTSYPVAGQAILTVGATYRVTGYARSSGVGAPRVYVANGTTPIWDGTTSTDWQYLEFTVTAGHALLGLQGLLTSAGYVEFDDIKAEAMPVKVFSSEMPRVNSKGYLRETEGTNKAYINYNFAATTGYTATGGTLTQTTDAATLAGAGLAELGNSVIQLANATGSDKYVYTGDQVANTNAHSVSVYGNISAGSGAELGLYDLSAGTFAKGDDLADAYARTTAGNMTPGDTDCYWAVKVPNGCTVQLIGAQIEESAICTSLILNSDTTNPATRAADVLTVPSHGVNHSSGELAITVTPNGWSTSDPNSGTRGIIGNTGTASMHLYVDTTNDLIQRGDGTNYVALSTAGVLLDGAAIDIRSSWSSKQEIEIMGATIAYADYDSTIVGTGDWILSSGDWVGYLSDFKFYRKKA